MGKDELLFGGTEPRAGRHCRLAIGFAAFGTALIATAEHPAAAAELCVNANGIKGCYTTIQRCCRGGCPGRYNPGVAQGTYREHVIINKPLSLIGADAANTIIDAGGPGNGIGIYIDGMDNLDAAGKLAGGTGLNDVVVQGSRSPMAVLRASWLRTPGTSRSLATT